MCVLRIERRLIRLEVVWMRSGVVGLDYVERYGVLVRNSDLLKNSGKLLMEDVLYWRDGIYILRLFL